MYRFQHTSRVFDKDSSVVAVGYYSHSIVRCSYHLSMTKLSLFLLTLASTLAQSQVDDSSCPLRDFPFCSSAHEVNVSKRFRVHPTAHHDTFLL